MQKFDFAIVGYGPTGATMAHLLARRGYTVAVIDKEVEIFPKPRAITADHEVMRIFQECGLAEEIAADTEPHPGTDYVGLRGQIIKRFYPMPSVQPLAWEPTFMFVQPKVEAQLRHGLQRYSQTVEELVGHELVDYVQDDEGVDLHLKRISDDTDLKLRARYLLGCDGGRSVVRRQTSSDIEDLAFDEWWIVIDALLNEDVELPERCVQYCRPWRPGTYIVGPDRLRRWEIKLLPGETPDDFQTEESLRRVLANFVDENALDIIRTATYRFHALVVNHWRDGRVFLMGDAAHQMPPFLGQGLCAGVRDTVNLAWKLDLVERYGASPTLLDSYEQERKSHVRTVVEHAKSFGLIIGELDMEKARLRDARLEEEIAAGTAETIRQKFIPNLDGGLVDTDEKGRLRGLAGKLFVQPWVSQSSRPGLNPQRLDDVVGFDFLVAATTPKVFEGIDSSLWHSLQRVGARAVVIGVGSQPQDDSYAVYAERDELFKDWMSEAGACAVLVRPDRYVYGSATNVDELNGLFDGLLRRLSLEEPLPVASA